jgi:hypothetical protein
MKKLLIVLLALFVAAGAFAQVTPFGQAHLRFGANLPLNDIGGQMSWPFSVGNSTVGVKYAGDSVEAVARIVVGGPGDATWSLGVPEAYGIWKVSDAIALKAGITGTPSDYWSSLGVDDDSNWGIGATAFDRSPLIQLNISGFYVGLVQHNITLFTPGGNWNGGGKFPGFFVGYDHTADSFTIGGGFKGQYIDVSAGHEFPFLGYVHGKFNFDPMALGFNVGIHNTPAAWGAYANSRAITAVVGTKDLLLEGLIDFTVALEPATIAITGGFAYNLAKDTDGGAGMAMQIGASGAIGLADGFTLNPGIIYTQQLKAIGGGSGPDGNLYIGAALVYAF